MVGALVLTLQSSQKIEESNFVGVFVIQTLVFVLVVFIFMLLLSFEGARINSEALHFL